MCAGVRQHTHGSDGSSTVRPSAGPSAANESPTALLTAWRSSSTSFGRPPVPDVGMTSARSAEASPPGIGEQRRLTLVDHGGGAGEIHDRPAFAVGQTTVEGQDRMLRRPEVGQDVAPRRARRQIDRHQGAGSDAQVPAHVR